MENIKTIGTGSEKGTFTFRDPHPFIDGRVFSQYVVQDGNCYEKWITPEKLEAEVAERKERRRISRLSKRKNIKAHQTMLPHGYFSRWDKHPWQASLLFKRYDGELEQWRKEDALSKHSILRAQYRHSKRGTAIASESKFIDQLHLLRERLSVCLGIDFHLDHTIPVSKGGTHTLDNLEVVPASWNERKSNSHCNRWTPVDL